MLRRVLRPLRLFLLLLLLVALRLSAALPSSSKIELTAPRQDYDLQSNDAVFSGGAYFRYGEAVLTADEIRYNTGSQIATAEGHAVLTMGSRRLLADKITYHVDTGSYTVENLRAGEFPAYLQGATAEGTKETLTIHQAVLTLREPGRWAPSLAATTLTYQPGQRLRAERARIGVAGAKPIALPNFDRPIADPFWSLLSFNVGFSSQLGAFVEVGARVPLTRGFNLGGDLSLYTKRGALLGPSGDYLLQAGTEQETSGSFHSGYIHDTGNRLTDILNHPIGKDRGYFSWEHRQKLSANLTLDGQLNYWRDSEVLRDFKPALFYNTQTPDSYLEATYTGDNYHVALFSRVQPNSYHQVQERLPELRFDLLPYALPGGFYQRLQASAAWLREDLPDSATTLKSQRLDAYYSLSRPIKPRDWFDFTPLVGGRLTHYQQTNPGAAHPTYDRWLGEIGADARLRASAVYEYKNERWHIDGLRHVVSPRVSYRYIPGATDGAAYIPAIDRSRFTTYLPPLGLGDIRNLDDLRPLHTLRVALDNTLQTRDPVYGSRDLAVFNVANDFRFERLAGERELSETHVELGIMPVRWLQFDLYETFSPQDRAQKYLSTGVTVRDGEAWTLRLGAHHLRNDIEAYYTEGLLRLNEAYSVFARIEYDARRERFNSQRYGLYQNIDNTWRILYAVEFSNGPRRESNFGFHVGVEMLRF